MHQKRPILNPNPVREVPDLQLPHPEKNIIHFRRAGNVSLFLAKTEQQQQQGVGTTLHTC